MVRALPGVALSSQTGNEFQLDLNYRGFIASPVIGTPQGLAVYQNGVRINEIFGDIVNWDFIPQNAINQLTLVPSNPVCRPLVVTTLRCAKHRILDIRRYTDQAIRRNVLFFGRVSSAERSLGKAVA